MHIRQGVVDTSVALRNFTETPPHVPTGGERCESLLPIAAAALGVGAHRMQGIMIVTTSSNCIENGKLAMRGSKNVVKYEYADTKATPAKMPMMTSRG